MRSAGLQRGDPPAAPSSPAEPARPALAAPEDSSDLGGAGGGSPVLGSCGCLWFGPSLGLPLPPPLSPSGCGVKAAAESFLPGRRRLSRGRAGPASPRSPPVPPPRAGAWDSGGDAEALHAIHPLLAWGGLYSRDGRQAVPHQLHALPDFGTGKRIPL